MQYESGIDVKSLLRPVCDGTGQQVTSRYGIIEICATKRFNPKNLKFNPI
jgi:hypothetical protein